MRRKLRAFPAESEEGGHKPGDSIGGSSEASGPIDEPEAASGGALHRSLEFWNVARGLPAYAMLQQRLYTVQDILQNPGRGVSWAMASMRCTLPRLCT
jgi:hypothetical protein